MTYEQKNELGLYYSYSYDPCSNISLEFEIFFNIFTDKFEITESATKFQITVNSDYEAEHEIREHSKNVFMNPEKFTPAGLVLIP